MKADQSLEEVLPDSDGMLIKDQIYILTSDFLH